MTRIALISDSHNFIPDKAIDYFADVDEIWHAGDVGTSEIIEQLSNIKPLRGVYGNIDGPDVRKLLPHTNYFRCEKVKVMMQHIVGYPKRYSKDIKPKLQSNKPKLLIAGHSHILKVMFDKQFNCLFMNPGAIGKYGFHKVKTMLRFTIDGEEIKDLEVVELGSRTSRLP